MGSGRWYEEDNERIDIIGQNGNTGEHYEDPLAGTKTTPDKPLDSMEADDEKGEYK